MSDNNYADGDIFNYYPERDYIDPNSPLGRFKTLIAQPDATLNLAEAALVIASQEYPGLKESAYLDEIDQMADDVSVLLSGETDPWRVIGILNDYLFNKKGFHGNQIEYNDPCNSYLNDVLDRHTGIPITLSLVYLEIARRLQLPMEGLGLPGHFIVRYHKPAAGQSSSLVEGSRNSQTIPGIQPGMARLLQPAEDTDEEEAITILIDPFNKGDIISEEDCIDQLRQLYGRNAPFLSTFMRPVTNHQFLTRLLNNLKTNYSRAEDFERTLRIEQFIIALNPSDWSEIRDRGAIHFRLGHFWSAIHDMRSYLRHVPNASDTDQINNHIRKIYQEMVVRN